MGIKMKSKQAKKTMLYLMVVSALTLPASGTVYAEQAAEQNQYSFDQIVVTANRVPTKLAESAANVTVITGEEIQKSHYRNLGEVLRNINGVMISEQGHPGAGNYVRLNGDDRVVIMIDGRRMNMDKGAASGRAGYDLNSLATLQNIERIEVVKGAASALYGSDAVGGVINIITKQGIKNQTSLDISAGSWGQRNYQLTQQGKENGWSWMLTANKEQQDYFSYKDFLTGKVKKMPNSDIDNNGITFRLDKEIDATSSVTLNFEHADSTSGQPYMVPGRSSWGEPMHFPYDYRTSLSNNLALTYNFDKGKETAGYVRVYQNYYTSDSHSYRNGRWSPVSTYSNKARGLEAQDAWRLDEKNLLVGGVEWRDTKVDNPGNYNGRSVNNKAVYLEDRMAIDEKWTLSPGVRVDHHNMFGSKTTPRASLNYKMDDDTNMYVSWGKVFNAPNTDDLFWPDDGWTAGNPNLKPETGNSTSIGINKKLNNKTQLTASYFKSQLNDAINWAPNSVGKWMPSNVDKQRKQGAEIEIRTALSPNWRVTGAYSYLKVENMPGGSSSYTNDSNNSQPNGYRLSVDYSNDLWNVGITGRGASGRSLEKYTSSSYWVWDAVVNYKMNNNANAYVKINNITNRAYEINGTDASYGGPGGFPMPARNYQVGVQYYF